MQGLWASTAHDLWVFWAPVCLCLQVPEAPSTHHGHPGTCVLGELDLHGLAVLVAKAAVASLRVFCNEYFYLRNWCSGERSVMLFSPLKRICLVSCTSVVLYIYTVYFLVLSLFLLSSALTDPALWVCFYKECHRVLALQSTSVIHLLSCGTAVFYCFRFHAAHRPLARPRFGLEKRV